MRKPTGKVIIEWYDRYGHKEGECERNSYGMAMKIANLWESLDPGNSVVISRILYNTKERSDKWTFDPVTFNALKKKGVVK